MATGRTGAPPAAGLSSTATRVWRAVQTAVWLVGFSIFVLLIAQPAIGLHAFWNVLIPVAPALLAVAPGLWRNICPLGSTALAARHAGLSSRRPVSLEWQGRLQLAGILVLFAVVPLRHVVMDTSGPATALALVLLASAAVLAGFAFEWKSGWCSGLCPVHPVERLYGTQPAVSVPNMHCSACAQCVAPCPDSTSSLDPLTGARGARRWAGLLLVGGFAGFIWGWFQVADYHGAAGWAHLSTAYGWPLAGTAATLLVFLVVRQLVPARHHGLLIRAFAAAAIACYYWYRLPMLFGFGPFPGDGMLLDLTGTLPGWFPVASQAVTTLFFAWWLVGRRAGPRAWGVRPAYA